MGKGTKTRTQKLSEALADYEKALNAYNGELMQVEHDKGEIEKDRLAGKDIAFSKKLLAQRLTIVLPKDRDAKNLALTKLQTAYKELSAYFNSKKPKEKTNPKYDAMKLLIEKVKQTGVVEV